MGVSSSWSREGAAAITDAAARGLFEAGEVLAARSSDLAPLEEGVLAASAFTSEPADNSVTVSFDTPYAWIQHENLDYVHAEGRTAKYLETPTNEFGPEFVAIVGTAIRREMG